MEATNPGIDSLMESQSFARIVSGMDVFDRSSQKVGTVARVYRREAGPSAAGAAPGAMEGFIEVKTGLLSTLGLGKRYYVPFSAVHDVTEGGVFLSFEKSALDQQGWDQKPALVEKLERSPETVAAPAEVAHPAGETVAAPGSTAAMAPGGAATPAATTWEEAAPFYRARWQQRYGAHGAQWESYEPRYRFAWEMANHPDYRGRSWITVQPDLRRQWEVRYPAIEWDQVADTVRDAWEHTAAGSQSGAAAGQQ
jgi:hypothetical protein